MLLNNRQAAMDSALETLAESLDYFYDHTGRLASTARDVLMPHFDMRRGDVDALKACVRDSMQMLPREADRERDDYRWLWSRLKGVVGGNTHVLLSDLLEQERAVMRALSDAWTYPLPPDVEPLLERLILRCRALLRALFEQQAAMRPQRH